jgi:hypothetical protein
MKHLMILITFFVFTFCTNTKKEPSTSIVKGVSKETTEIDNKLPSDLVNFVQSSLRNYSFLKEDQYIQGWKSFTPEGNKPFFCEADFNGDNRTDYALILIDTLQNKLSLLSFFRNDNSFNYILIDTYNYTEKSVDAILSIKKGGQWETIDETFVVPYDGINIDFVSESLSKSYFWKENKFNKVLYD